jgi:two-component system OmpR family sensor kinase
MDGREVRAMISLRRTILVWITIILVVVGAIAAIVSYEHASEEATDFLDGQLRQIALNLGDLKPEPFDAPGVHTDPEDQFIIEVHKRNGEIIRSPRDSILLPLQNESGFSIVNAGGRDWRVYTWITPKRTVQIAQQMAVRQELAERAATGAATPILVAIPLAWLVIGWTIKRTLDKLAEVVRAIGECGPDRMDPIPIGDAPSEVRPLIAGMNDLIARLQSALDQQRRFLSDAAHQLRTPLTALGVQVDNLRTAAKGDTAISSELGQGVRRTSKLLEQLLRLARFDAPPLSRRFESLDLVGLVKDCVAEQVPIATKKGVDLGLGTTEAAEVSGAPAELKILFGNIIDNAVRYTPPGGAVDVSIYRNAGRMIVEIADSGPGVSERDLPRLTERFFRACSPDIEGSGLGLAIAEAISKRHGFEMTIANRAQGGLAVSVACPLRPV